MSRYLIWCVYGNIAVKLEQVLNWNSITKRLGQDLFTTAWLAHRDVTNDYGEEKHQFVWPAVIITDDVRSVSYTHLTLPTNREV